MRSIFGVLSLLVFFSLTNTAQSKSTLEGSWKIVSMDSDLGYFNFKTDSFSVPGGLPPGMDSAATKALVAVFGTMISESIYVFGKNGKYEYFNSNTKDNESGSYTTDTKGDTITTVVKRNNVIATDKMQYSIKDKQLHLTLLDETRISLVLERLPEKR